MESAVHDVPAVEPERALLRGPPKDFDITAETIMSTGHDYNQAVSKLIVIETHLNEIDANRGKAMAYMTVQEVGKCHVCGNPGNIA